MRISSWMLIGVLLMLVCLLSGCEESTILIQKGTGGNGSVTNNYFNVTQNTTINNTYNFTVSDSTYACSGTDKLMNVSIVGGAIVGVCSADLSGGGGLSCPDFAFCYFGMNSSGVYIDNSSRYVSGGVLINGL